ncbi:MAG TPA: orotidine-5'-phosphate decarboxylase, partial [Phycisphaerales bacterium]|nr:orotidine-5'-phosphate decarboxylase [Phycisphaerales bacterium]
MPKARARGRDCQEPSPRRRGSAPAIVAAMLTPPPGPGSFADRLAEAVARAGSPACVGLDPVLERLPEEVRGAYADPGQALVAFSRGVIDAVAGIVPAVKFQSACYERHDLARELRGLVLEARAAGLLVVLDAKRGDIGISAEHYAHAAFSGPGGADALTVSGYLGPDALAPFLVDGHGLFVLVRTSNPGSDQVQSLRLEGGRSVAEMMAGHVRRLGAERVGSAGLSDVGAVVGATKAADAAALRELMPEQVFLVPGY